MRNVRRIIGGLPPETRIVRDLTPGEHAYTVPWAYNRATGELHTHLPIGDKSGTFSLRVECVEPGRYDIKFEEPEYSRIVRNRSE